jgi:hypothetical protein
MRGVLTRDAESAPFSRDDDTFCGRCLAEFLQKLSSRLGLKHMLQPAKLFVSVRCMVIMHDGSRIAQNTQASPQLAETFLPFSSCHRVYRCSSPARFGLANGAVSKHN